MKLVIILAVGIIAMAKTQNLPAGGHSVDDLVSGKAKLDAPPGQEYTGEYKPAPEGAIIQPVRKANGDSLYAGSGYPSEPKEIDGRYNAHGPKFV